MYEELEHTADWALRVRGRDLPALFENAALGMMELSGVQTGDEPGEVRQIELQAVDTESLLVDWLQELLVALELEQLAFREIELEITDGKKLVGTLRAPNPNSQYPAHAGAWDLAAFCVYNHA